MRRMAALTLLIGLALGAPARAFDVVLISPLWDAVATGDAQKVERTLITGENPDIADDSGKSPLIYAALANNPDIVAMLVHYRARVDYRDPLGNTALAYAAEKGSVDAAEALIAAGAAIDSENRQGVTPLMLAAGAGETAVVRLLIDKGAAVDKHDYTGRTALDWAERGRHASRAAALLRRADSAR